MSDSSPRESKARPRPFWRGLAFRGSAALGIGIAVVMLAAGWFHVARHGADLDGLVVASARRWTETIKRSTRDAMLLNQADMLTRILQDIGEQEEIDRIRVYDHDGRLRRSTDPEEIRNLENGGPHGEAPAIGESFLTDPFDARVLAISVPIENEAACAACHSDQAERSHLGTLEARFSLATVDRILAASERELGFDVLITVVIAALVVSLLFWRLVLAPVHRLTEAADRVAAGDFSARMPIESSDEMGELARHWNEMVDELDAAHRELKALNEDLEARVEGKTRELHEAYRRMIMVEKMASLGKLSAVVAHEINNPLAGITTYAKLLRRRFEPEEGRDEQGKQGDTARILKMVEEESARCGRIVQNLLLFSRAPTAKFSERDIGPILERCALLVRHQAELQDVEIEVAIAPDLVPITCDAAQIQQVVIDLMMNAIEAMPDGGHLRISAEPRPVERRVVIRIADDGVGIEPEIMESIFEPFFTTKSEGHGVGLGLAVAYGIVERHGGLIKVSSEPGRGTEFRIHLPLDAPTPIDAGESDLTGAIR